MPKVDYRLERWSLDDLFPGLESDEYRDARQAIDQTLQAFEGQRARLTDDLTPQGLFEILQAFDGLQRQVSRYVGFAYLRFAEDTQDPAAQTMRGRADQLGAEGAPRDPSRRSGLAPALGSLPEDGRGVGSGRPEREPRRC